MAKLYITEYAETRVLVAGAVVQVPLEPPAAEQVIDFTDAAHHESAAFQTITTFIRMNTDSACSVAIGTAPVASAAANGRLSAGQTEFRGIRDGLSYKVSVITNT